MNINITLHKQFNDLSLKELSADDFDIIMVMIAKYQENYNNPFCIKYEEIQKYALKNKSKKELEKAINEFKQHVKKLEIISSERKKWKKDDIELFEFIKNNTTQKTIEAKINPEYVYLVNYMEIIKNSLKFM